MMNTHTRAAIAIDKEDYSAAIALLEVGQQKIMAFYEGHNASELTSESAEIYLLDEWLQEMRSIQPFCKIDPMLREMDKVIASEEYEWAAQLRRDTNRNLQMYDHEQCGAF